MKTDFKFSKPWAFFALAIGWTWLFLVPAIPMSRGEGTSLVIGLRILAGIGPAIAAISLLYIRHNRQEQRNYGRRAIDFRRISPAWLGVTLLTVPVLSGLAVIIDQILGGAGFQLEAAARFLDRPLEIIPFAVFILLFGPLPEELGWRGYALDQLQNRWNALQASLILGSAWALWHLPLFFIVGTYQYDLGTGTASFWMFNLNLVTSSVLYTWIFNNTGGSTISAILFHFSQNFTGELVELTAMADFFNFGLAIALATLVVVLWNTGRGRDEWVGERESGRVDDGPRAIADAREFTQIFLWFSNYHRQRIVICPDFGYHF